MEFAVCFEGSLGCSQEATVLHGTRMQHCFADDVTALLQQHVRVGLQDVLREALLIHEDLATSLAERVHDGEDVLHPIVVMTRQDAHFAHHLLRSGVQVYACDHQAPGTSVDVVGVVLARVEHLGAAGAALAVLQVLVVLLLTLEVVDATRRTHEQGFGLHVGIGLPIHVVHVFSQRHDVLEHSAAVVTLDVIGLGVFPGHVRCQGSLHEHGVAHLAGHGVFVDVYLADVTHQVHDPLATHLAVLLDLGRLRRQRPRQAFSRAKRVLDEIALVQAFAARRACLVDRVFLSHDVKYLNLQVLQVLVVLLVVGRGSWVVGHGSWVVGRGSRVVRSGSWAVERRAIGLTGAGAGTGAAGVAGAGTGAAGGGGGGERVFQTIPPIYVV